MSVWFAMTSAPRPWILALEMRPDRNKIWAIRLCHELVSAQASYPLRLAMVCRRWARTRWRRPRSGIPPSISPKYVRFHMRRIWRRRRLMDSMPSRTSRNPFSLNNCILFISWLRWSHSWLIRWSRSWLIRWSRNLLIGWRSSAWILTSWCCHTQPARFTGLIKTLFSMGFQYICCYWNQEKKIGSLNTTDS